MKKLIFLKLVVFVTLLNGLTTVQADTLAGVANGGLKQSAVICNLFNAGPGDVTITSIQVLNLSGTAYQLTSGGSNCGTVLSAGTSCGYGVNIGSIGINACRIVINPSGANVRGHMEIRDSAENVITSVELR